MCDPLLLQERRDKAKKEGDSKQKQDPNTAGFWACYGPSLFGKQLGLKATNPW